MFECLFCVGKKQQWLVIIAQGRTASQHKKQVITAPVLNQQQLSSCMTAESSSSCSGAVYKPRTRDVFTQICTPPLAVWGFHSLPAFSFSPTVWSPREPPIHGGLLARVLLLSHCSGVLVWMANAWTQLLSSSFKASFTRRWHLISGRPSNWELTSKMRKCDSDPGGTACMWLSLWTSKRSGLKASVSLIRMALSTGLLVSTSMCRPRLVRGRIKARPVEMGRTQQSIWCRGTKPPKKPEERGSSP